MVQEITKQVQFFNKVITLVIVIIGIMSVIIASNMINSIYQSEIIKIQADKVASLDNIIRGTLEDYKPDRESAQLSRDTIQDINKTTTEILGLVKK